MINVLKWKLSGDEILSSDLKLSRVKCCEEMVLVIKVIEVKIIREVKGIGDSYVSPVSLSLGIRRLDTL